jgi:GcrA cell cycle regulator
MRKIEHTDWTAELIETLRVLWNEGHSGTEIGRRMGLNKNQVIGKVHRLGLPKREPAVRVPPVAVVARAVAGRKTASPDARLANLLRVERAPRRVACAVPLPPGDDAITLPGAPLGVLEERRVFSDKACQFPLWGDGDRPTHRYCGDPVIARDDGVASAYCKEHGKVCWTGTARKAGSPKPLGHHGGNDRVAWRINV